jgi:hypothetical protein
MNENTCSNQSSILDQLRAIPEGRQVRFTLRRPDGSEFTHVSAIGRQYIRYPDGFDTVDKEIALATPFDASKGDAYVNEFWVRWTNPGSGRCGIVAIEQLAPPLPDLETLRKWVADCTQVRIEYDNEPATMGYIGASPVTCKLLDVMVGEAGLAIKVPDGPGTWNMFLDRAKGCIGPCRPLVTSITPVVEKAQTAEEIDTIMQRAAKSGAQVGLPYSLATGNPLVTPTCCADVAPYIGRRVRVSCVDVATQVGIITRVGLDDGDACFWLDDDRDHDGWGLDTDRYDQVTIELLPDEPAPDNLVIEPKCPADLEPYLGRPVRVLAGPERELVCEGILTSTSDCDETYLYVTDGPGWYYGARGDRCTLVEVLPELPATDADETSIEDESDDAVSAGYMPSEPVLRFGTVMMQVDGGPELVKIEPDGNLTAQSGRRLCLTTEGDAITAPRIVSKLTLADLLAMAPPPSEVRAYEAFQDTVRQAMLTGLVRY